MGPDIYRAGLLLHRLPDIIIHLQIREVDGRKGKRSRFNAPRVGRCFCGAWKFQYIRSTDLACASLRVFEPTARSLSIFEVEGRRPKNADDGFTPWFFFIFALRRVGRFTDLPDSR